MKTPDNRSLQSFRRIDDWKIGNDGLLQHAPAAVLGYFTQLDGIVVRIEANAVTQVAEHLNATRDATDADVRRQAVRDAMRPIAQVARTLRGTVFGISAISTMPNGNTDNEHLVIAANSMAQNASILKGTLVDHGLAPDCIETLSTAAAALKSSIDARGSAKAKAVGARDGIHADFAAGKKLVSLIDAALSTLLKNDPVNLASWKNVKRVTVKGAQGKVDPASLIAIAPSATPAASIAAVSTTPAATQAVTTTPTVSPVAPAMPRAA